MTGRAVHAVGGDRAHYRPVRSVLHGGSNPIDLARACFERLGLRTLYLADLDAIAGAPPAVGLYRALEAEGLDCWVDAGVRHAADLRVLADAGVSTVVVGSETLAGPAALDAMLAAVGPDRIVFSLDLKAGRPMLAADAPWGDLDPRAIAAEALRRGVRRILVLDLARVGSGTGLGALSLVRELASRPAVQVAVGGGIASRRDIEDAGRNGAGAVLVGTALHTGLLAVSAGVLVPS